MTATCSAHVRLLASLLSFGAIGAPATGWSADFTIERVALSGDAAHGGPAGAVFSNFNNPGIDANGNIATTATISSVAGAREGVWSFNRDGSALPLAISGEQASGAPEGSLLGVVEFPLISQSGHIAFQGSLMHAPGAIDPSNDEALWLAAAPSSVQLGVREGSTILAPYPKIVGAPRSAVLSSTGSSAFLAEWRNPVTHGVDGTGIWRVDASGVTLVAFTGQQIAGFPNGAVSGLDGASINAAGSVAFRILPAVAGSGLFIANALGDVSPIALIGEVAPGTAGRRFQSFFPPAVSDSGLVAVSGDLTDPRGGRRGAWVYDPSSGLSSIAQPGEAAPGGGVFESYVQPPNINSRGDIVFSSGSSTGRLLGLFIRDHRDHELRRVADGQDLAGLLGIASARCNEAVLNGRGHIAFVAEDSSKPSGTSYQSGLFFADGTGEITTIALEGDTLEVAPGDLRVATDLSFVTYQRRGVIGLNDVDHVAFRARFADGSVGIFVAKPSACNDGLDNDDDGYVDFPADRGCKAGSSNRENPDCDNGVDDDGDGLVDSTDPSCLAASSARENAQCQDGVDNDGEGEVDFDGGASANGGVSVAPADLDCAGTPWRSEFKACGLGAELLGVLVPLWRVKRRGSVRKSRGIGAWE